MNTKVLYNITMALFLSLFVAGCSALRVPSGQALRDDSGQVAKAAPAGGPQKGIKVHGDWVIEVKNPDGTLADRREFKNALSDAGKTSLAQFLGRQFSVGRWGITLSGGPAAPCVSTDGAGKNCLVVESTSTFTGNEVFKTLTVSVSGNQVVLDGTATAQANSAISLVRTTVSSCASTNPPSTPCEALFLIFTDTTLSPTSSPPGPIPVSPGQQIKVTVTISFS